MDDKTGRMSAPRTDESEVRTQEIREEIAQTRVEMSETIDAIQERLTPSHLVAQASETVRNATSEKVKQMANTAEHAADRVMDSSVARTLKSNPIPAAMIGVGAAWLIAKGRSGAPRRHQDDYSRYRTSGAYDAAQRDWRAGQVNAGAVGTSGYIDYGSELSGTPRPTEFADVRGYERDYGRSSGPSMSFERVVRENPLVVGAAAALVGVAIGMSLPASDAENRLMGETRDNVVDRAKDLASEAKDKVQDVAGQAVSAATQVRDAAARATGDRTDLRGSGNVGSTGSFESSTSPEPPGTTRPRSTTRRTTSS